MKKYCLTQCAKDKLWWMKEILFEILTALLIIIFVPIAIIMLGLIVQAIGVAFTGHLPFYIINPFLTIIIPVAIIIVTIVVGAALYIIGEWIFKTLRGIYKAISGTVKTFSGHPATAYSDCRIFEECTVEPTNEKETV